MNAAQLAYVLYQVPVLVGVHAREMLPVMSTFDELRTAIGQVRAEVERHEREVVEANERLHRLQRDRAAQARRGADPAELDQAIDVQQQTLARLRDTTGRVRTDELDLLGRFEEFSDPREQIGRLTDRIPICLVPLRLEYRFKRAGEPGGPTASDELWVRVYPDDISVDSFEHTLTETEASDARTYWASVWSAGGDEAARRGAWKVLLAGQGSGRSFWVTQQYAPLNPEDQPEPPADRPLGHPVHPDPRAARRAGAVRRPHLLDRGLAGR